jgi:hypothetical protein
MTKRKRNSRTQATGKWKLQIKRTLERPACEVEAVACPTTNTSRADDGESEAQWTTAVKVENQRSTMTTAEDDTEQMRRLRRPWWRTSRMKMKMRMKIMRRTRTTVRMTTT